MARKPWTQQNPRTPEREWTQSEMTQLTADWIAGLSVAKIASRLDRTLYSAGGKIGRMCKLGLLDNRPSPLLPSVESLVLSFSTLSHSKAAIAAGCSLDVVRRIRKSAGDIRLGGKGQRDESAIRSGPTAAADSVASDAPAEPEPTEAPLWTPPPKIDWPPPSFGPAPTCQFPLWAHHAPTPRPALFCGAKSFRDSFCSEHWLHCHNPRLEAAE